MTSQQEQQQYTFALRIIIMLGYGLLVIHFYYYCYDSFERHGYYNHIVDHYLLKFNHLTGIFVNSWYTKLISFGFLLMYGFANRPKQDLTSTWGAVWANGVAGAVLYFGNFFLLQLPVQGIDVRNGLYIATSFIGYLLMIYAASLAKRILSVNLLDDRFNMVNEQFLHEEEKIENEYSVNIALKYTYKNKIRQGWINVINPFRATMVVGTPGSGKSFAILYKYIRQHIEKGFTMMVYDIKYPTLTKIVYTYYELNKHRYPILNRDKRTGKPGKVPMFCNINFSKPKESLRINPLLPTKMKELGDAVESGKIIMYNINRSWIGKEGDFFSDSAINLLSSVIWYLKRYDDRRLKEAQEANKEHDGRFYCTLPHAIELIAIPKKRLFPILQSEEDIELLLSPFASALLSGAHNQLEGQVASALIALGRIASPSLYWVLTGNDFSLDINNPEEPKILCIGNNQERKETQGVVIGLINSRMLKLINKEHQLKSSLIIDELPSLFLYGLSGVIETGRSNEIAVTVGIQDKSQIKKMYGDKEADNIWNIIGNIFTGQVLGETAKDLSTRFGKIRQISKSVSINEKDTNVSLSERMEPLIPESKIASLSQGSFAGAVADNFDQKLSQKTFHGELMVEDEMLKQLKNLKSIPTLPGFKDLSDDEVDKIVTDNFKQVKMEIKELVADELYRISNDPNLSHLVKQYQEQED